MPFLRERIASPDLAQAQFSSFEGFKYVCDFVVYDKLSRSALRRKGVELVYSDSLKLLAFYDNALHFFQTGDRWEIKRVSIRKSDVPLVSSGVAGFLMFSDLLERNFHFASGSISGIKPA